jgi:hypothetical protein
VRRLLPVLVVAACWLASPALAEAKELSLTMDDGVRIDAALYVPDGTTPAAGWPEVRSDLQGDLDLARAAEDDL